MSRSGPICSLVLNLDLAYEKNDLESLLISAASFIYLEVTLGLPHCDCALVECIPILFV